ncbi:MAG: carboxypeptidase-like regulatory domain-containing protein, partial [Pyrinomonadaceae bacterium]
MSKNFKFISLLLSLTLCFSAVAFGQETTGEIQGTVKDQAGAVVPNVQITVTGIDVGFNRTLQTDNDGFY